MRNCKGLKASGLAAVSLGIWLLAAPGSGADASPKPLVPAADLVKLISQAVQTVQEGLRDKPEERLTAKRIRRSGILIAVYAQSGLAHAGPDANRLAMLRDLGLKLAHAIEKKDFKEATALAATLARYPQLDADPGAKPEPLPLLPHTEVAELMSQFASVRSGGEDIERKLDDLAALAGKTVPPAALTEQLVLLAYKVALVGDVLQAHTPDKQPKEWQTWARALRQEATELAEAAKAKNGPAAHAAAFKLSHTCSRCHEVFR
jgi:hypothetical protein